MSDENPCPFHMPPPPGAQAVHRWRSNTVILPVIFPGLVWDGNIASTDIGIILISDMKVWSDPFSRKWVQQDN